MMTKMSVGDYGSQETRPLTTPYNGNSQDRAPTSAGSGKAEAQERKEHPMASGVLDYFPNALYEIAGISKKGNDQHNPGEPLHWAKSKSTDHADSLLRHMKDRGTRDTDGERHSGKVAWRALAQLEIEILAERQGMTVEGYTSYLKTQA